MIYNLLITVFKLKFHVQKRNSLPPFVLTHVCILSRHKKNLKKKHYKTDVPQFCSYTNFSFKQPMNVK